MADEQLWKLALVRSIDRIKDLGNAAALIRAYTDKFIANQLRQVAKRWAVGFWKRRCLSRATPPTKSYG